MATLMTHAAFPIAMRLGLGAQWIPNRLLWTGVVCSMIPDLDVVGFWLGIPYGSMWGHRGISHSVLFAVMLSLLCVLSVRTFRMSWRWTFCYLLLVTLSHSLMDAITTGGMGVAWWSPFSNHRFFMPWRPILVSPIGKGIFSMRGLAVLKNEWWTIWMPLLAIGGVGWGLRWSRTKLGTI